MDDMTDLDRIILEFHLELQPDNYEESAGRLKNKIKDLVKDLVENRKDMNDFARKVQAL